ncbi:hypothetical protein [Paenibacillus sp. AR247]|uniref:hypothetical protein n=1 Tax=Paenibacillus sp. AR247 TaxID=1631599 RepID=UPI000CFA6227|nr:hypothetical protein [Paenibacillus sp. AR247]PQP85837.1 hypothetical protein CPT76_32610 [Paenibacillus sp. AR247]
MSLIWIEVALHRQQRWQIRGPVCLQTCRLILIRLSVLGYGDVTKNEINTFQGTVTKDLITKGTATAHLKFTPNEMREIYGKMREINIIAPKKFATSRNCSKSPSNEDEWTVTVDGKTESFSWTDRNCELSDDAIALLELRNFIQSIVNTKEAYQALPAAEGGYD